MADSKKSKSNSAASTPKPPRARALGESLWSTTLGLADETRAELHKQAGAVIGLLEGALLGATRLAGSFNDRINQLAIESLAAADRNGRQLASGVRDSGRRLASGTAESARGAAARASATAHALIGSSENRAA